MIPEIIKISTTGNDIAQCLPATYTGSAYQFSKNAHKCFLKDGEKNTGYEGVFEVDKMCCAMRGRNIENPSDRSKGSPLEQRLEPNEQGICNTLTSVQKDNLVLQIKANTKDGCTNMTLPGLIDARCPHSKTKGGYIQNEGQICPTIIAQEPQILYIELAPPDEYTSAFTDGENIYHIKLRKLTPRECWRLMGFPDEAFDKASKVNSNTQLYKQAGNSIVVNVLMAIFDQMNLMEGETWMNN